MSRLLCTLNTKNKIKTFSQSCIITTTIERRYQQILSDQNCFTGCPIYWCHSPTFSKLYPVLSWKRKFGYLIAKFAVIACREENSILVPSCTKQGFSVSHFNAVIQTFPGRPISTVTHYWKFTKLATNRFVQEITPPPEFCTKPGVFLVSQLLAIFKLDPLVSPIYGEMATIFFHIFA